MVPGWLRLAEPAVYGTLGVGVVLIRELSLFSSRYYCNVVFHFPSFPSPYVVSFRCSRVSRILWTAFFHGYVL